MKKGLMLLNSYVEDVEALATRALLIRSGYDITTFTLEDSLNITTAFGLDIKANLLARNVNPSLYDFLILPGGKHVSLWVEKKTLLSSIINSFNDNKKLIAAICAAPLFLNKERLLENKNYTIFSGLENQVIGNYIEDEKVVIDGNILTARSAGVVYDFVFVILKYNEDFDKLSFLKENIIY